MAFEAFRKVVTQQSALVIAAWLALATVVGLAAPNLTKLAAEGQAHLIDDKSESAKGAQIIREVWPNQTFESQAVVGFHRTAGLTDADLRFVSQLSTEFERAKDRPSAILRIIGPHSGPEIAERLISPDRTMELIAVPLSVSFVAPKAEEAVKWLQDRARATGLAEPAGLRVWWTGDASIGRDYMDNVQTTLDRAAMITVVLLFIILLTVYRSILLAAIPLITIGVCLVISRGCLAWANLAGWEISPLVELFLVVLLFGSGTDFCLFLSWRFAEHWDANNVNGAMRVTLRRSSRALLTSAGTVFIGLMLMGTTRFKLFSSTGPSVALGLLITLAASLTLTPALLVVLARFRPRSFKGMTRPSSGFWDRFAHRTLRRPALSWSLALLGMLPLAYLGTRTEFTQDTLEEMPAGVESAKGLRLVAEKFGPGTVAPLTVVIRSADDLRESSGVAWIDEVSRMLSRQPTLQEVRSPTQPLGSTAPLDPARLSNRLAAVDDGFNKIEAGAGQLRDGLASGLDKLRAARMLQDATGLRLLPTPGPAQPAPGEPKVNSSEISKDLIQAGSLVSNPLGFLASKAGGSTPKPEPKPAAGTGAPLPKPQPDPMIEQLGQAVDGSKQIADGIKRAQSEIETILKDPVGRRALDRLLITPETIDEHPDLARSFKLYYSKDGREARIDVNQKARMFSTVALDNVRTLREKLHDRIDEEDRPRDVQIFVAGPNADSLDIRTMTRDDQWKSWFVIPIGVSLVLLIALRDPLACVNLVATMLLTYLFALGATHFVFITIIGMEGLDWKVPYFLFVLLVAVGVDYNVFLMARLHEETGTLGLKSGIARAVAQTGGLISSAAAITAISFASLIFSPLWSLKELGFALVVGISVDALVVRPLLVPCGQWLLNRRSETGRSTMMQPVTHRDNTPVRV